MTMYRVYMSISITTTIPSCEIQQSSISQDRLSALVDSIQRLNPTEYEEMFKLLHQNKCDYTRNNNGVFLNLSWLSEEMIDKLEIFVKFCHASRKEIQHYEQLCDDLSEMVSNAKHEHSESTANNEVEGDIPPTAIKKMIIPKASSTMKFYLLKKKYAKTGAFDLSLQSDLEKEPFII